jgi:hypothetical protein
MTTALLLAAGLSGCSSGKRPASWGYISPMIFQPTCATPSCHSRAAAVAGLDFSDPDRGYTSLTGLWVWLVKGNDGGQNCGTVDDTTVCERMYRPLLIPYAPDESRVVDMLRARNAPRMPPDRPLSESDIRLVETWILNGALRHEGDTPPPVDGATMDAGNGGVADGAVAAKGDGAASGDGATDGSRDGVLTDGPVSDSSISDATTGN